MKLDRPLGPNPYDLLPAVASFDVSSDDVRNAQAMDQRHIYDQWGVGGSNESPHLAWRGFPAGTKSFAVTCYDPDAPTACGFWHWLTSDIPVGTTTLARNSGARGGRLPHGAIQYANDYAEACYGGPAPPPGDRPHRYYFVVHALDVDKLGLPAEARPAFVGFNLTMHALARAILVPVYGR